MTAMNAAPKISTSRVFSWLLAALVPIFAIVPALVNAIEEHAYDAAEFHIFRGIVWSAARADGSFYPRWVQSINGGLGGPLFEFYSPLSYFLMDLLSQVGISHTLGWRLLMALVLLAASTGMFGLALSLFKRADIALLCAAVFTYNAYLLRDLFERGSPQGWTVALLPWLLWLLLRSAEQFSPVRIALTGLCFASMMLLHNATALLLIPVVLIFVLFLLLAASPRQTAASMSSRGKNAIFVFGPILGLVAGLGLAAFYLIPFIAEIPLVQFDNPLSATYALPAANPMRLGDVLTLGRFMDTGLGNNAIGEGGGLLPALAMLLAIPIGWSLYRAKRWAELFLITSYLLLIVGLIWLQTESADLAWNALPWLNVFQFRWRLLAPFGLVSSLMLGYFLSQWQTRYKSGLICLVIAVFCFSAFPLLYPGLLFRYIQFSPRPTLSDAREFALKNNAPGLTSFDEYLPRWRQTPITSYITDPMANLPSDARVSSVSRPKGSLRAQVESPSPFNAAVNILYFPGWVAYVDGITMAVAPTADDGLITVAVPAGVHSLELRYEGTFAQHIGDAVSAATSFILLVAIILWRVPFWKSSSISSVNARLGAGAHSVNYLATQWWIPAAILLVAVFKTSWVDPETTLFRATSTCEHVQDTVTQANVVFDHRVRMCGYALSGKDFGPGDPIRITIYWQVEEVMQENDYSFVHLLGEKFNPETGNPLWGQQDKQIPAEHSLKDWVSGKLYRDVYTIRVAPSAPTGGYQLEIGWQNATGHRLEPLIMQSVQMVSASHLESLLLEGIQIR